MRGCEPWSLSDNMSAILGLQMRCLSHICGVKRSALNHVTNESLLNTCRVDKEILYMSCLGLHTLGHPVANLLDHLDHCAAFYHHDVLAKGGVPAQHPF